MISWKLKFCRAHTVIQDNLSTWSAAMCQYFLNRQKVLDQSTLLVPALITSYLLYLEQQTYILRAGKTFTRVLFIKFIRKILLCKKVNWYNIIPYLGGNLEGLVVAAVLLRLLGHQPHVGDVPGGLPVELTVLPAHSLNIISFRDVPDINQELTILKYL